MPGVFPCAECLFVVPAWCMLGVLSLSGVCGWCWCIVLVRCLLMVLGVLCLSGVCGWSWVYCVCWVFVDGAGVLCLSGVCG